MKTNTDEARTELANIKVFIVSGEPGSILKKAVELGALLAGVNEETAYNEVMYNAVVRAELKDNSATAAQLLAKTSVPYSEYKVAEGIGKALNRTITSLHKYADNLIAERKI